MEVSRKEWSFPLLQLPENVLKMALERLNCVDLIDFSLCSKKCKSLVQKLNHGIDGIDLSIMANNSMIMMKSGHEACGFVDFESTWPLGQPYFTRYIRRRWLQVCKIDNLYYCRNGVSPTLPLKPISEYLIELFRAPLHITIIPNGFDLTKVLKEVKTCESLTVSGITRQEFIEPNDLAFLMENLKPNWRFSLCVRQGGRFYPPECPEFGDVDHLEMDGTAEWMTRQIFLRLSCKTIRLSFCHLKAQDFVDFVTQWFFSNDVTLEYVEVWFKVSPGIMHFTNCNMMSWDGYRRSRYYNNSQTTFIDCCTGFDIIRKDGAIGTVVIFCGSFHFIVWKDYFKPVTGYLLNLM